MFKELCRQKTLTNVLVVTMNWGQVGEAEGKWREKALAGGFFKSLLDKGACMVCHDNTANCACSILYPLLYKAGVTTKIQDELVSGMALANTLAVRRLVHAERGKRATRELNRCVNHT